MLRVELRGVKADDAGTDEASMRSLVEVCHGRKDRTHHLLFQLHRGSRNPGSGVDAPLDRGTCGSGRPGKIIIIFYYGNQTLKEE